MARPKTVTQCRFCGFTGSARERLAHTCTRPKHPQGRRVETKTCDWCREEMSAAEFQVHHCPRTREDLIAWLTDHAQPHRLHGEGSVPVLNGYGTWWCFVSLGRKPDGQRDRKKFTGKSKAEAEAKRDAFIRTLTVEVDHRGLENRSVEQLRSMYRQVRILSK